MLHTGKLYRAELYDDCKAPYSNVKTVYEANKNRYPGKKLIVTNGHWCEAGPKPCAWYRVGGVWLGGTAPWACLGLTWSDNDRPIWRYSSETVGDNFICTIPAIVGNVVQRDSLNAQTDGVKRNCTRTWWGWDAAGKCSVEVTTTKYTLDKIVERMQQLGIMDGIVLDGSGSSQWYDGKTRIRGDGRTIYEYLLLWFEDEQPEPAGVPYKATVSASSLAIRKGPSSSYGRIDYVRGDEVEVLEELGGWGRTDKGWISLSYVKR